jgi:hypothetical protein
MSIDYGQLLLSAFYEAFMPVIQMLFIPFLIWVIIPGFCTVLLFRSRKAYPVGAFLGLMGLVTIGPLSAITLL